MARIRSVKPELRRDLTVADWPRECRYAWVLLWGYLDDEGRGIDDLRLLVADLFPLDRDVTEKKLGGWLERMAETSVHGAAPLCRYEVRGRRLLHAPKWGKSQRVSHPQTSSLPPCPTHESSPSECRTVPEPLRNGSGTVPEPFTPSRTPEVQGVKGSRGQGVKGSVAATAAESEGQRVNRLAATYTDAVPLSNFPAVAAVVRKAVRTDLYDDLAIRTALRQLADDGRSVTTDSLRYALTPPTSPNRTSAADSAVAQALAVSRRFRQTELANGESA